MVVVMRRCARCGHQTRADRMVKGFGRDCAAMLGLVGGSVDVGHTGPDLLDLLTVNDHEEADRPAGEDHLSSTDGNTAALRTDAGLFALWSPASFSHLVDYDSWAAELLADEDIARHVRAGVLVPVNIGRGGAFQFLARVGSASAPAELTDRERTQVAVISQPYLFVATDGAVLSAIEHVGPSPDPSLRIPLPPGRWQVTVTLIDWHAEPGQRDEHGAPRPGVLPDFTLLINPEPGTATPYRTNVETFDGP